MSDSFSTARRDEESAHNAYSKTNKNDLVKVLKIFLLSKKVFNINKLNLVFLSCNINNCTFLIDAHKKTLLLGLIVVEKEIEKRIIC